MSRRATSLRSRLVAAFVGVVCVALVVGGVLGVVGIARAERRAAVDDLRAQATSLRQETEAVFRRAARAPSGAARAPRLRDALDALRASAHVADARIVFVRDGVVLDPDVVASTRLGRLLLGGDDPALLFAPPTPTSAQRLAIASLATGETSTSRSGDLVELATRLRTTAAARTVPVLVVSRVVDTRVTGRAVRALGVAAVIALVLGVVAAIVLARRLTASLRAIGTTARAVASGDLDARVELPRSADREIAEVAHTIDAMAGDLDDARGAQRAFLQAIGHDLRTPVTAVRGWADAIVDGTVDPSDPDAVRSAATVISAEATRLERLVRDLLDLARLDAHEFSLHPQTLDVEVAITAAVDAFRPAASDRGVTLDCTVDPVFGVLDGLRLAQIVANLLENALDHCRHGVQVRATRATTMLVLQVSDDGDGIPDDARAHVFERHWSRRRSPDSTRGSGLGLTIVRELARAMGGDALVARSDANGTCIEVRIALGAAT